MSKAAGGQKRRRRPVHLVALCLLEGVTSLFVLLWFVLLPGMLFHADHLATLFRPVVIAICISILSLLGWVTSGGLWFRRAWAFRFGVTLAVCTLAFDLLWIALSFAFDVFELGPLLLLALNGGLLFLFLEPAVARAMGVPQER